MAMEFLKPSKRRTAFSDALYVLLNLLLAAAALAVTVSTGSPIPGFVLILLSKWRVLALRPQHWMAHIVSNMIDIIVGLSYIVFINAASGAISVQIILTILYAMWLLVLKPRSSRLWVITQAGIGVFIGVNALAQVSYDWIATPFVIGMWIIGYSAARHVLGSYKEPHANLLSLIWAMVIAEIGWVTYHWTFAYDLLITADLKLAQVALITVLISFLAERTYASYHQDKSIKLSDVTLPLLLVVSIIGILLTLFGTVKTF